MLGEVDGVVLARILENCAVGELIRMIELGD